MHARTPCHPRRYAELRRYCATIPCFVVANKIDVDYAVTSKAFAFPAKHALPFFFVSAADGTNVVQTFREAIGAAWTYKHSEKDFVAEVLELLGDIEADTPECRDGSAPAAAGATRPAATAAASGAGAPVGAVRR